jgi:hypothetical protein
MSDWTTEATDAIERAVVTVRDRTVTPARTISRGVVYGLLAALIVFPAVIFAVIGFFRGLVEIYQGEVWAAWLTLGAISVVAGMFCWAKRTA